MEAYSADHWQAVFSALAASAAALTGLLFVALSINLRQVLEGRGLVGRAVEVLILLTGTLIAATLLLMPAQTRQSVAIEVLAIGIALAGTIGMIQLRAPRKALGVSGRNFALRVVGAQCGPVCLLIGGVSLMAGAGGGLYWVVPALLATTVAGIVGAWVMLVEILR